jgi:rhamnogalacturonyl hydrolase YesR
MKKLEIAILLFFPLALFGNINIHADSVGSLIRIIRKVNDNWQSNNSAQNSAFWHNAVYHMGNMEVYFLTKDKHYLTYSMDWANFNQWRGAMSDNKQEWKYTYGETDDYVLFGDWQACFQVYADIYKIKKKPYMIARAREVMEYQMSTKNKNYWWWADGLYMVMPVMTKMYKITNNPQYLEKLYEYFSYADSLMYDYEVGLYYRDGNFVYPKHYIMDGKKDFWARGDGWVIAALAKVIQDLPQNNEHRKFYIDRFTSMAKTLANCQLPEGYWSRSLLVHDYAPGPETSGTAFFTFGLQWGINYGLLDAAVFQPVVDRSWHYLSTVALQPDGRVGYVQPIGAKAIPGQILDANSTANFGVGAFLLAACERVRYVKAKSKKI